MVPIPLILCLALFAWPHASLALDWKPYGLQGRTIRSLASGPDRLCAGTQGEGVFCRDLASAPTAGWVPLGPAGTVISWIWIDPARPDVMLAAAVSSPSPTVRLYRTLDGGLSWQRADAGNQESTYAVHGVPGTSTIYKAGWGVWRSDDLGDSWVQILTDGGLLSLDMASADPNTLYAGGESMLLSGFTYRSRDGGSTWQYIWDSWDWGFGDNQTADIAAHPSVDGLLLSGHESFVLRSANHGNSFQEVLSAPARLFLDWDGVNPARAYAAGSPNTPNIGHAFVSRDFGSSWSAITGSLAGRTIFRLEADDGRLGVLYAATGDGVQRFYGGGLPLCMDNRAGLDQMVLTPGECPPIMASVIAITGDAVIGEIGSAGPTGSHVDLGEVECVIDSADISLVTIDPPEPPPGRCLFILARPEGSTDYGGSSDGLPRRPSRGDCAP
ncbi:MAG TPA: hypothetical protein VGK94_14405 [Candidatus Polarisedimenticolia bacterium]|jgi:hypothetical protein